MDIRSTFGIKAIAACIVFLTAANTQSQTVQDAVQQALDSNPVLQAEIHNFSAANDDVDAAKGELLPTLGATAGYSWQRKDYTTNRQFDGFYSEINLSQVLFDKSKFANVSLSKNNALTAYFTTRQAAEQLALETLAAYTDVLRYRELLRLAKENLATHNMVFRQIENSVQAGVARSVDLEQVRGRLSLAQSNVITEETNLNDVTSRYLRIVGSLPRQEMNPVTLTVDATQEPLQKTLEQAFTNNYGHAAARYNVYAQSGSVAVEKGKFIPKLELVGSHSNQDFDQQGLDNSQEESRIDVRLSYNFYTGGIDSANKRRAYEQRFRAQEQYLASCLNVRQESTIAHNNIAALSNQLPLLDQHRKSSDRVRAAYKQQFDIGQRTLLDVLDSENEHFQASRAWVNATNDLSISIARSLANGGALIDALNARVKGLTAPDTSRISTHGTVLQPCPMPEVVQKAPEDDDLDGIVNSLDACPSTPRAHAVNSQGCTIYQPAQLSKSVVINFEKDSTTPAGEYAAEIADIAHWMANNTQAKIQVEGHASKEGAEEYNRLLSIQRANAVSRWLEHEGNISPNRIVLNAYGENLPIVEGDDEAQLAPNRRGQASILLNVLLPKARL